MRNLIENYKTLNVENYSTDYNWKKNKNIVSLGESLDLKEVIEYIDNNGKLDYFLNELENIKEDHLYDSFFHGKNHNYRVMLYTLYLSILKGAKEDDIELLMDAAKYHDIGRVNDEVDNTHGRLSAELIDKVLPSYKDIKILKGLMEIHSINDSDPSIVKAIEDKYDIVNSERFLTLYSILKDADALDRVRLTYLSDRLDLDINMFRNVEAKALVKAAFQCNEFMNKNRERYKVILDTDVENEIDDKFALAYLLKSQDIYEIEAITIAPFHSSLYSIVKDNNVDNANVGVEASYNTALRIMDMLNVNLKDKVYKGSVSFMDRKINVVCEAVDKIIDICHKNDMTHVIAIAGLTNIALAIEKDPSIVNKMEVIWLGGNSTLFNNNNEFNFKQDIIAVKKVFDLVRNLTVIPCVHVASGLVTTIYELEHFLMDKGEIGKYLCSEYRRCKEEMVGKSKTIWDLSAVAYLINEAWFETITLSRPGFDDENRYLFNDSEKQIKFVNRLSRDKIFKDFFNKIS